MRRAIILFMVLAFIGGCTVGGGGGGKGKSADEKAIEKIIEEFVQGWAEGTEQALTDRVFPHISNGYNHAGLDRDGYIDDALKTIERRRYDVTEHSLKQDVDVNGDEATDEYEVTFKVSQEPDLDIEFEVTGDAKAKHLAKFKKKDGVWKITSVGTVSGESSASGAIEGASLPTIEDLSITPTDSIAPGGEFKIDGKIIFPESDKQDGEIFGSVVIGLEWDYLKPNAKWRGDGNEIVFIDYPEPDGTYEFSVKLPADGEPEASIPEIFPLGADAIGVSVSVYVAEEVEDDVRLISLKGTSKAVRLDGYSNESVECADEPLDEANPEGIWRVRSQGPGDFHFFDMLDFASLQDSFCASFTLPGFDTSEPSAIPICGSLDGSDFSGYQEFEENCPEGDPGVFTLELSFSGLSVTGSLTLSGCGEAEVTLAVTGDKVSNRCEFVWHPDAIEGTWEFENTDVYTTAEIAYVGGQILGVSLNRSGGSTDGRLGKIFGNTVEAYPEGTPGIQVAQIAFDNTGSATFFLYDSGNLVHTSRLAKSDD